MSTIPKTGELRERFATINQRGIVDLEKRTVELSFSSDAPVDMGYGTEILSHKTGAMRLDRIKQSAPLLFNHDRDHLLGVVESVAISGGKGRAVVRFGRDERGDWAMSQVNDGILVNVSMMYQVHRYEEDTQTETYTALDWEPYEISLVTIPADPSVGIGRSKTESTPSAQAITPIGDNPMTAAAENTGAAADAGTTQTQNYIPDQEQIRQANIAMANQSAGAERTRILAIDNLCREHHIDERTRESWKVNGATIEAVSQSILGIIKERHVVGSSSLAYLDLPNNERKRYSLFAAINAAREGNWNKAGLELECHRAIAARFPDKIPNERSFYLPVDIQERGHDLRQANVHFPFASRDLTVGTSNAGGYIVETSNLSFIEMLRNQAVLMAAGATRLSGLVGNINIPKQTGAETAYWLATEATAANESQMTLGQLSLTPKTVAGYTELSRLLTLQSSPSAEGLVMNSLAKTIAIAVDLAGINANGSGAPIGIINTSGIGAVTGTSLAYADIIEFQTDVAASNALADNSAYITTPAVAGLLKERVKFSSTASPIWEGKLNRGMVDGYAAFASNQVPTADMIFGDFSQLIIAEWGQLEIEVNPYANFAAGISGIRAMYTVDIGLRVPAAFSLATSIT